MIVAHDLTRTFGRLLAVDSVAFRIPCGQVVGFLGPNGAGKTTTIRMITGYLPPTRGSVEVDGLDVRRHWRDVRQRIGYLPEATPLYTEMRVTEFLAFRGRLFGLTRRERREAMDRVIDRCWLGHVHRRPIHQLSKGYRQRVGLAAALLHEPPVLILDEPTIGLDPSQVREMRGLIRELAEKHTILLSSHILPEVEVTCDRIIMIDRGRVRADGTIDDLRARAARRHRYVIETDLNDAESAAETVSGVSAVEPARIDDRWVKLTITADESSEDLREPLARAVGERGGTIRELRREAPSLEQLFMQTLAAGDEDSSIASDDPAASNTPEREGVAV